MLFVFTSWRHAVVKKEQHFKEPKFFIILFILACSYKKHLQTMYFILRSINSQKQLRLNDMRNTLMSVRVCYYYVLCSLFFHGVFLPLYTSNKKINRILIRRSAFPAKIHELFEIVRMSLFAWMDNHKTYTRLRVGGYAFVLFYLFTL